MDRTLWSPSARISLVPDEERHSVELTERLRPLIDEYRDRCLWFLREDYCPANVAQALRVLDYIERHGDRKAFLEAAEARKWLLQTSSEPSVV